MSPNILILRPKSSWQCQYCMSSYVITSTAQASHTSYRLRMVYDTKSKLYNFTTKIETMPIPRVMGDAVLLPNGYVIIINGATVSPLSHSVMCHRKLGQSAYSHKSHFHLA